MDVSSLFWSVMFGIAGIGYFSYGRKHNLYFMLSGIVLMIFPYFVTTYWPLMAWGVGFLVLPFVLSKFIPL